MITLSVNKFLGALTNLIAYSQVADTQERGKVGEFVSSFQDINVENGDGKVVLSADLLAVKDLDAQSSLLTVTKPTVDEQYVSVENYKVIPMTINRYLVRGAFVDETQLANFIGYLMGIMKTTKVAYLSDALIAALETYKPAKTTQTIKVQIIKTEGLTDPMQLQAANTYNANAMQKAFINKLNEISFPTAKYNDLGFKEIIDFSSMKLLIRQKENSDIIVDSLAYLLNSDKITEAQKWSKTFVIPDEQFTKSDNTFVAWLMHNKKIQYGYFYEVATSFFDGSTLNQQDWLHFSYYLAAINAYPCICFQLDTSLTPAALKAANA